MAYGPFALVDQEGHPLDPRIARVVQRLAPRLRRTFPELRDDVELAEVVEETARRVARRDERGEIARIEAYAWATLRTVTISRLRTSDARVRASERPVEGTGSLALRAAQERTPDQAILLRELLEYLHGEDRMVSALKLAGLSSDEIGRCVGLSPAAVDTIYCRAKDKLRRHCT